MNQASLHRENMEDVRERLETSVYNSSVETLYDKEECFIIVTQYNETTGFDNRWDFCVDFGTGKVQMLEPTFDEEGFTNDNEVFRIIKNFLNGGSSREKRMNRPDYNAGEPIKITGFGNKIGSSKKPIKSSFFKSEDVIAYLVGGDGDTITAGDEDEAAARDVYYYGYGIMDDGEKGHLFVGKYDDVKDLVENYLGLGWTDEFAYPYIINGTHITDSFQFLVNKPLPTEKDYQDFVNQLNTYVTENYGTDRYGPLYKFGMYKEEGTNSDGYGHEYPYIIIYDENENLDMHSDDDITEYIRKELEAKGWYPEAVHSSSDFTIAVM